MPLDEITIIGAREHNLKGVTVRLPKNRLVVFTGVSGSGKSSLAFDTLFAEGQRRYVESLSAYARQFLGQLDKPRYDSISGLSPTISIEQKTASHNPRSTVGTITEVHDYLRVLYARVGRQHCHSCGRLVTRQTAEQIRNELLALPEGTRVHVLAPLFRDRKGEHRKVFEDAQRQGFVRLRVDGQMVMADEGPALDKNLKHTIELVIDRLVIKPDAATRLNDSVEAGLKQGGGRIVVLREDGTETLHSEHNHCEYCSLSFPELSPQLFSFNTPLGMCPDCNGLGRTLRVDPARLVPDPSKSISQGAVALWTGRMAAMDGWSFEQVVALCRHHGVDMETPWRDLPEAHRALLLHGSPEPITVSWTGSRGGHAEFVIQFEGAANVIERRFKETTSEMMRTWYQSFFADTPCRACNGSRLRPEARAVRAFDRTLPEVTGLTVGELAAFYRGLNLSGTDGAIAGEVLKEIGNRLRFLINVGLPYLTLDRTGDSLSGGEAQRIRLASQLGNELTGVTYILDEPSIGLHQRDNRRLVDTLCSLRDLGNTVVVVEHDRETIESADHVVDFGPGAGKHGGEVVHQGDVDSLKANPASLTGRYLSGELAIEAPRKRRKPAGWLEIRGARAHNLKDVDARLPLGVFSVVTGVSGAGKSSLVNEILWPAAANGLNRAGLTSGPHREIRGLEHLDKAICIDQDPIGRTPRSNPATYTKLFDQVRDVFAATKVARMYGYAPGRFSFNVKGGRCEHCKGDGSLKIEMHFLPDVYIPCPECLGKRFNEATLKATYRERSIADVLAMTVDEGAEFFAAHKSIVRILRTFQDVGLGYLELGQPSPTLSGGEAQRIKLARELARPGTGRTLYVMDEPSTGLHFDDVRRLLQVVQRLADRGNTVVMIEHNLDIIAAADWVLDLGPEGGEAGGRIIAEGTPEQVAQQESSYTGQYLARIVGAQGAR
jgi:excinuclease ABC subunit A